jgi:amidase
MSETLTKDLAQASAGELARALAARQVSAVELADAAIGRIETLDGPINAVVVRDFDRALQQAKAADAALARGERRALLGVPMTVKESHNVAGLPTTWGSDGFRGWVAPEDAVGVARLKAAGAVILGKTNIPPFLSDWQSANPIYGQTNNPWDLGRSPGGSSGGGAAALAAGMVPLEFGSDIGGSIRVPAAFCGVYGHKPSFSLVPAKGHQPPGTPDGAGIELAVVGPMARTAADLERALGVVAGPYGGDAKAYRLELPKARRDRLADYRVLVLDAHPLAEVDDEVAAALAALAGKLEAEGAEVAHHSALLPDLAVLHDLYGRMLGAAMSRGAPPGPDPVTAEQWMGMLDGQMGFRLKFAALFEAFDVILAPAFGVPAFPHDHSPDPGARILRVNGHPTPYFAQMAWQGPATLANLPATVAPMGLTRAGLPIGVQVIGPYLEDLTTIGFAVLMEQAFGGFVAPPGY